MKDLGPLTYFLGLEIHKSQKGIYVNQHKYLTDIIHLVGLRDSTLVDTPMEANVKFRQDEYQLFKIQHYIGN